MAPLPNIFIEVPITYREIIEVLTKLGYHPEFDGTYNRYINEKYKSIVILPVQGLDETMEIVDVAVYARRLYRQGVIKEEENLIKKVQANRLKKGKKVSKNEPMLA